MSIGDIKFYQAATVIISAVMIYYGLEKFIRREANQSWLKLGVRLAIWGSMAAVALFPSFTNYMANLIGIMDNINAVILIGFLLTFLIIFKILSIIERIEHDISTLTRRSALKRLKKEGDEVDGDDLR